RNLSRVADLQCWQEARELTRQLYEVINQNPAWNKNLLLCGQIQSASGSVMANIAEGFACRSGEEFAQFLSIALSAAAELQSHLHIAADHGYLPTETSDAMYSQPDRTKSRQEKLVRDRLAGQGIEQFLPTIKRLSQWKDRKKEIEVPLFSGYCFARFTWEDRLSVRKTYGVANIVGNGHGPEPIPDE